MKYLTCLKLLTCYMQNNRTTILSAIFDQSKDFILNLVCTYFNLVMIHVQPVAILILYVPMNMKSLLVNQSC